MCTLQGPVTRGKKHIPDRLFKGPIREMHATVRDKCWGIIIPMDHENTYPTSNYKEYNFMAGVSCGFLAVEA